MQTKRTRPHMRTTQTPGIYEHGNRFVVVWTEDGKKARRSFPNYEQACVFRRDYVTPFRERKGLPPSIIAPPPRGEGWVYGFQSRGDDQAVKIGFSTDPGGRLKSLTTAHPHGMDIVLLVPGSRALEQQIHEHLSSYRLGGEWFSREALRALSGVVASAVARPSVMPE